MKPRIIALAIVTVCGGVGAHEAILTMGSPIVGKTLKNIESTAPKVQVSVYRDLADCVASGYPEALCRNLLAAASARAWQTASLYIPADLCEERYGRGGCIPTKRKIRGDRIAEVHTPLIAGVAVAANSNSGRQALVTLEPIYRCPRDRQAMPVCYQSVTGQMFSAFDKDVSVEFRTFDKMYRNAERERIGDDSDDTVGHRLIDDQYQLVQPRSENANAMSRTKRPPWPGYIDRSISLPRTAQKT